MDLGDQVAVLDLPWFFDYSPVVDFKSRRVSTELGTFHVPVSAVPRDFPAPRTPTAALNFISARRAMKDLRSGCGGFLAWVEVANPEEKQSDLMKVSIEVNGKKRLQLESLLMTFFFFFFYYEHKSPPERK